MKPGAVAFLVLVVPALSAPNPFRLPSFFGGGNGLNFPFLQPQHHYYPPPPPPAPPPAGSHAPGEPPAAPPAAPPATPPEATKQPLITLPFAPALNAPFYVPTLFAPAKPTSAAPAPVTVTIPANPSNMTNGTTTYSSLHLSRRGSNLGPGNAPATPLPTPPANR